MVARYIHVAGILIVTGVSGRKIYYWGRPLTGCWNECPYTTALPPLHMCIRKLELEGWDSGVGNQMHFVHTSWSTLT